MLLFVGPIGKTVNGLRLSMRVQTIHSQTHKSKIKTLKLFSIFLPYQTFCTPTQGRDAAFTNLKFYQITGMTA